MLRGILNAVSIAWLFVAVVAVTLGVVVLAVWLIRRSVPATREGFHAEISAPMLGVVAALFGLLLAFVIIIAYENFLATRADVSREADALASLVRDSAAFEGPQGAAVRHSVGVYAQAVVNDEWPLMREGKESPRAAKALDDVFSALQSVKPGTAAKKSFFDDAVTQSNAALAARRDRLEAARGGLPIELAALILFSSFVIVAYAVLVGSPNFWFHVLGPAAIASVIAFSLLVLIDLSYPLSGDVSITSDPFRQGALAQFF